MTLVSTQRDPSRTHPIYFDYASEMLIGDFEKQAMRGDFYCNRHFDPNVFEKQDHVSFQRDKPMLGNVFRVSVLEMTSPSQDHVYDLRSRQYASRATVQHHYHASVFLPGALIKDLPLVTETNDNTNCSWFYYLHDDFASKENVKNDQVYGLTPHGSILNLKENATLWLKNADSQYETITPTQINAMCPQTLWQKAKQTLVNSAWPDVRQHAQAAWPVEMAYF